MNYLSLFSGICGGDLGLQHLLGWKCKGYVEYENYCQKVIQQRITDGFLDAAPIFGDIRKFISDGYAEQYTGMVDVVSGGFPCPSFSSAAHGHNCPEKDMWFAVEETLRIIYPTFFFGENVSRQAIIQAASDLNDLDYSCAGIPLSAKDLGADHIRTRYWILAHTNNQAQLHRAVNAKMGLLPRFQDGFWKSNPYKYGMDDELPHRVDRLKAIGNAQVPVVAATAWRILSGD